MNRFLVGEIATLRNLSHWTEFNGSDCQIILPEAARRVRDPLTGQPKTEVRYICQLPDGRRAAVPAACLRKKGLPMADEIAGRQAALCCINKAMRGVGVKA